MSAWDEGTEGRKGRGHVGSRDGGSAHVTDSVALTPQLASESPGKY